MKHERPGKYSPHQERRFVSPPSDPGTLSTEPGKFPPSPRNRVKAASARRSKALREAGSSARGRRMSAGRASRYSIISLNLSFIPRQTYDAPAGTFPAFALRGIQRYPSVAVPPRERSAVSHSTGTAAWVQPLRPAHRPGSDAVPLRRPFRGPCRQSRGNSRHRRATG